MKLQNTKPETTLSSQSYSQRLSEIGIILANAIYRLKSKEASSSINKQLDFNFLPSVHSTDINSNKISL